MDKKWQEMTPEEKRNARIQEWVNAEGVEFQSPEAKATYQASINRLLDAVLLRKIPDRIPISTMCTFMPASLYGVTAKDCLYDYNKLVDCYMKFTTEFNPDYAGGPAMIGSGKVYETLDMKFYSWSGGKLGDNLGYQYEEKEYMRADEYDAFITDPSDFWLRTYLPRIFGSLAPLANIPAITSFWEVVGVSGTMIPFGIPDVQKALMAMIEAGNEAMKWIQPMMEFDAKAKSMGYPSFFAGAGATKVPFDMLGDTLRGTRGIMMDMYRQPAKLMEAIERITPICINQGVAAATLGKHPIVFIPLHKGADGFMSDAQFKKFYWPGLKTLVDGLAKEGCIPLLFCEGGYNSRIEYLRELDRASCFWIFDRTDMVKVKEVCQDHICIGGNVPAGLIVTGTAEQVRACCKDLIDNIAPGGGYIMGFGTALDEGKAETVREMIEFTKTYGVYK